MTINSNSMERCFFLKFESVTIKKDVELVIVSINAFLSVVYRNQPKNFGLQSVWFCFVFFFCSDSPMAVVEKFLQKRKKATSFDSENTFLSQG